MTFADLMTLLMCFFVLLLSFSEMDVAKFKQLSGSMKDAFGVQAEVEVETIPKGTSVIAQEFSPGKPEPTALERSSPVHRGTQQVDAEVHRSGHRGDGEVVKRRLQAEEDARGGGGESDEVAVLEKEFGGLHFSSHSNTFHHQVHSSKWHWCKAVHHGGHFFDWNCLALFQPNPGS